MSKKIKVLSFDLDDTLWPCAPTVERAERLLYQWLSLHVPMVTQHYDLNQLRDKRYSLISKYPELAPDLTMLRIRSFEQLAEEFGLASDWIEPAFEVFYQARQQVDLFDDVRSVLDELKKDYRLVSVTAGNADTAIIGVDHWFDFALNSATIGKVKSKPDIYWQVQKLADIGAQQMVHIGDDPIYDIASAKSAGVFAIWLNRDRKQWALKSCQPDAVITSLYELPSLLKEI